MNLKKKLSLWQLKLYHKLGNEDKIKRASINGHMFHFKKTEEMVHAYREIFITDIYRFRSDNPRPLIIDCGAHIGMSLVFFKQLFPNSRILAFEPDPESFSLLQENTRAFSDITLEPKAVWIHNKGVSFEQRGDMSSRIVDGATENIPVKTISSARLRDYLTEPVDMLKMDIEGVEIDVLLDCKDRLHLVKNMFVEFHGRAADPGKLQTLLQLFVACNLTYYIKMASDWAPTPFVNMEKNNEWEVQLNIFCKNSNA